VRKERVALKHHVQIPTMGRNTGEIDAVEGSVPESGRSKPAMQRRSVVFPHPTGREAKELAFANLEGNAVEDPTSVENADDVGRDDGRPGGRAHGRRAEMVPRPSAERSRPIEPTPVHRRRTFRTDPAFWLRSRRC
jgi:hypothetical protein